MLYLDSQLTPRLAVSAAQQELARRQKADPTLRRVALTHDPEKRVVVSTVFAVDAFDDASMSGTWWETMIIEGPDRFNMHKARCGGSVGQAQAQHAHMVQLATAKEGA